MLIHLDARRDVMKAGSPEQTLKFCADHFLKIYKESLSQHGSFSVALSGGSTPKALFSLLTKEPYASEFDWSKVFLFWGDERAVGPNDPESNFHMAMEAGFSEVSIPESHIHRMVAEQDIEENALKYEALIQSHLKGRGFDLVVLGMGEDGHTASLFPDTEGLNVKGRLVIANYVPQKDTWRMTLTFECINKARHIAIYVLGASKQEMLKKTLSGQGLYPIENIGTESHKALWIVDDAAAELLTLKKRN
jgi:6-phosphogluconolactonase